MQCEMATWRLERCADACLCWWASEASAAVLLTDNFSDNNYTSNPAWTVGSGVFAADGSNIGNFYGDEAGAGMLAFGTAAGTKIYLGLPEVAPESTMTIDFDLFQSNYAAPNDYRFTVALYNREKDSYYYITGYLYVGAFGTGGGASGFNSWTTTGQIKAGAAGRAMLNGWQHVQLTFNPSEGVSMYYGGNLVSSFTNYGGFDSIDELRLANSSGTLSWFADNVVVSGTPVPEPSSMAIVLGGGAVAACRRRRGRR